MREAPALLLLAILGVAAAASLLALRPATVAVITARAPAASMISSWNGSAAVVGNPYEAPLAERLWQPNASETLRLPGLTGAALVLNASGAYRYTGCILPGDDIDLTTGTRRVALEVWGFDRLAETLLRCGAREASFEELVRYVSAFRCAEKIYTMSIPEECTVEIDAKSHTVIARPPPDYGLHTIGLVDLPNVYFNGTAVALGGLFRSIHDFKLYRSNCSSCWPLGTYTLILPEGAKLELVRWYADWSGEEDIAVWGYAVLGNASVETSGAVEAANTTLWRVYNEIPLWPQGGTPGSSTTLMCNGTVLYYTTNPLVAACAAYDNKHHVWYVGGGVAWWSLRVQLSFWWMKYIGFKPLLNPPPYAPPPFATGILLNLSSIAYPYVKTVFIHAPLDSVVCWWIDYNHDGRVEPGERGCTWTLSGTLTLTLPAFTAYNASFWVVETGAAEEPTALIPGGGLAARGYNVQGLVINATLPGGSLRVYNGTVVYAEALCATSLTISDAAGHSVTVTPAPGGIRVTLGTRVYTLPCRSGYRVYWYDTGLVTVETDAASATMRYAPPEGRVELTASGPAWMGLMPAG